MVLLKCKKDAVREGKFSNPAPEEIKNFYHLVCVGKVKEVKKMLKQGFPPNAMLSKEQGIDCSKNAALHSLDDGDWSPDTLDIIDLLLDYGIDINHRDSTGNGLLIYIMDALQSVEIAQSIRGREKFKMESVIRLKKTFDKVMRMGPSLALGNMAIYAENIFELAVVGNVVHWFEDHMDILSEENKTLLNAYRLISLFEVK